MARKPTDKQLVNCPLSKANGQFTVYQTDCSHGQARESSQICITDVQKSIDKISGQAKRGQYII